jgi:hypothetical protein
MEEELGEAIILGPAAALRLQDRDDDEQQPQPVYCAVGGIAGKEEWKANLQWVLANVPRSKRLVLAHLRRPPSRINMSAFLASCFFFLLNQILHQFLLAASMYVVSFNLELTTNIIVLSSTYHYV